MLTKLGDNKYSLLIIAYYKYFDKGSLFVLMEI